MTIYYIQILAIFLLAPLVKVNFRIKKVLIKGKIVYLVATFFFLGIVSALRTPLVGTDTQTYFNMFGYIKNSANLSDAFVASTITAPIYVTYAYLLGKVTDNLQLITAMNSVVILVGLAIYIYRSSNDVFLSTFVFVGLALYYESMNGARQFMAIVMLMNAFIYFRNDIKSIKGWILFVLACGIHNTAILFIVAILGIIISKRFVGLLSLTKCCYGLSVLFCFMFLFMLDVIIKIFPYYSMYVDGSNPASIMAEFGGGRIVLLYLFLLFILSIYIYKFRNNDSAARMVCWAELPLAIFCIVTGIYFCKNILFNRLLWYFIVFFISIIPNILSNFNSKSKYMLYGITIIVLLIYCLIQLFENKSNIVPYEMFLNL